MSSKASHTSVLMAFLGKYIKTTAHSTVLPHRLRCFCFLEKTFQRKLKHFNDKKKLNK